MRPAVGLGVTWALIAAWLLVLGGCAPPVSPPAEPGPETTSLALFELANSPEPTDDALRSLFGPLGSDRETAGLRDLLEQLSAVEDPRIESVQRLPGLDRFAVDLTARLPSGGSARYSIQIVPEGGQVFRVVWFHGPGVAWPPQRGLPGEGLSTSAPPEAPD